MLERLRKLRKEAEISQKQLADSIGVSQQSINKYENHNIEPDIETLIRIADYFHVSVDYLIGHYTKEVNDSLNEEDKFFLSSFRDLDPIQKEAVKTVIKSYKK